MPAYTLTAMDTVNGSVTPNVVSWRCAGGNGRVSRSRIRPWTV